MKFKDTGPVRRPEVAPQQHQPMPISDDLFNLTTGDNFNELASKTALGGGLVLRSERDWNKDITLGGSSKFMHLFDLDVQQLAQALMTIPFHERFNLDDVHLSNEIKDRFRQDAERISKPATSSSNKTEIPVDSQSRPTTVDKQPEAHPMHLRLEQETMPVPEVAPEPQSKEEIQDWLDNVLDL